MTARNLVVKETVQVNDPVSVTTVPADDPTAMPPIDDSLKGEIDALSLRQALLDFETANARVLDLTARLVEANQRAMRAEIDAARAGDLIASAEKAASSAEAELNRVSAERDGLRPRVDELLAELGAHRDVIAARDADLAMFWREIEARDEVIRVRTDEIATLRSSSTYRWARRIGRLSSRLRSS